MDISIKSLMRAMGERPVVIYPAYRRLTGGSWSTAAALAQLIYWWQAVGGRKYHKTDSALAQECGLSADEIKTVKRKLRELPFLIMTREGLPAKTHYDIDAEKLAAALADLGEMPPTRLGPTPPTGLGPTQQTITEKTTENITSTPPTPPTAPPTGDPPERGGGGKKNVPSQPLPSSRDLEVRYGARAEEVRAALIEPDADLYVRFRAALREKHRSERDYRRWLSEVVWPELQRLGAERFRAAIIELSPRLVDPAIKHPTAWLTSQLKRIEPPPELRWNVSQMWGGLEYRPVDDDGHPVLDPIDEAERDDLLTRGLARWIEEPTS